MLVLLLSSDDAIDLRPKVLSKVNRVRFKAIKLIAVWKYPIHFLFLPSYRLA